MASLLVGETTSAVPARAWTADSFVAGGASLAALAGPAAPVAAPTARAGPPTPLLAAAVARDSAEARATFPVVSVPAPERRSGTLALGCAVGGLALIGASFAWRELGDRRYDEYLAETEPERIEDRWRATRRADQLANGSLIAGEALLAGAAWLYFVHRPHDAVAVRLRPDAAALVVRW